MKNLTEVIRRPIITEKSTLMRQETNQYVFEVDLRANKHEIKDAVQRLFDVDVLSVNTMVMPGRSKRFGRFMGRQNKWKRAVVTLREDQVIDFYLTSESADLTL
ncbi:MAG: 50S ribosomal protein L23 [Bradymonadales bacterium]|jgi:large subunit ribosomal protein L23